MREQNYRQDPREKWLFLALAIGLLMVGMIFVPSDKLWDGFSTTRSLIPDSERLTTQQMGQELYQIEKELWAYPKGYTEGSTAYRHMNRLVYLGKYGPFYKKGDPHNLEVGWLLMKLGKLQRESAALREIPRREVAEKIGIRFTELRDNSPDSQMGRVQKYTIETRRHWSLLSEHLHIRYTYSVVLAFFFFVSMFMYYDRLIEEIRDYLIFRIILASAIWPIAMWYFPSRYLAYQAARTFVWLRCVISAGIALAPTAIAKAQKTVGEGESKSTEKSLTLNGLFFSNFRHDRQAAIQGTKGLLAGMIQNRITTDSKTGLTFVGAGVAPKFGKTLKFFVAAGPQMTYERRRVDRVVLFANSSLAIKKWVFVSVNRQSFGLDGVKTPFGHRHIQTLRGPPLPSWLALNAEELYSSKKWRELFLGVNINLGSLMGRKKGFWKGVTLFPHWDAVKGNFDCSILYNFSH